MKDLENVDPRSDRRRELGSISDASGHTYRLFTEFDQPSSTMTRQSIKLAEVFSRPVATSGQTAPRESRGIAMTTKERVRIGRVLAWGVLQTSSTGWLEGHWTEDHILLVTDFPDELHTYVTHGFRSSRPRFHGRRRSSTLSPYVPNGTMDWAPNAALFALSRVLVELCYGSSIEDLAQGNELDNGKPYAATSFLTVTRLAHKVQDIMGLNYARAVKACLDPALEMPQLGKAKHTSEFAKSMMKNIIEPLEATMATFVKRQEDSRGGL